MKIELSDRCDVAQYVSALGIEGYNIRIDGDDYHIVDIEPDGLLVAEYGDEIYDYSKEQTELLTWAEINELYIY